MMGFVVVTLALGVLTVAAQVLAALLERPGPIRLRHWAEEAGGALEALFLDGPRFEAFRYLLSLAAKVAPVVLAATVAVGWILPAGGDRGLAAVLKVVLLVVGVLAAAELLNRWLVSRDSESALRRLTPAYRLARWFCSPAIAVLAPLLGGVSGDGETAGDEDEASDGEIEEFLSVGAREGILEPGEEDLIMRVMDFGDTLVRSVMSPRTDMVVAAAESPVEDLVGQFLDSKHSRIPLYRESVDDIVGILHIRDLFASLQGSESGLPAALANAAYFVPETKPINELLGEMQSGRHQMAIVVDEYGGTSGLVTVEDLLEEIVGEIVDEHEDVGRMAVQVADNAWRISGRTPIDWLEETFDWPTEDEPYETAGGMVFGHVGDLPEPGYQLEVRGLRFTVERVADRRIEILRVEWLGEPGPAETNGDA